MKITRDLIQQAMISVNLVIVSSRLFRKDKPGVEIIALNIGLSFSMSFGSPKKLCVIGDCAEDSQLFTSPRN